MAATQSVRKIEVAVPFTEQRLTVMKKIVPDPPRNKPINTPFFNIRTDMPSPDALAHAQLYGQQAQE